MSNYPFRRTCKEVAALVVAREDRHLNVSEKLALRTHMLICKACPHFEQQILTMRNAMRQWRNYTGDALALGDAPIASASVSATVPASATSPDKAAK